MELNEMMSLIKASARFEIITLQTSVPGGMVIDSRDLLPVCRRLFEDPALYFDMLSCVTGLDNGPGAATMEVLYHLYSIPFNRSLVLKVILTRDKPEVESVSGIWKSANWLEREVYDMFGIHFDNHPDLRRILMPNDWVGYPLRKDYQHQELYRDIKVKY